MGLECKHPNYIHITNKQQFFISKNEFLNPHRLEGEYYEVRCGKCLGCRLYQSYQKASRLLLEAELHKFNYFVTLTFNEEEYSKIDWVENPLREGQLFMKRLRKRFQPSKIKYYLTSEVGSMMKRFHYHIIIFSDIDLFPDMYLWQFQEDTPILRSLVLDSIWQKGIATVDFANFNTMRYTANYVQDTKESVRHSFSKGLGDDNLKNHLDGLSAIVSGRRYVLTRTQREKLGIEKPKYVVDKSFILTDKQREVRYKELLRRHKRK